MGGGHTWPWAVRYHAAFDALTKPPQEFWHQQPIDRDADGVIVCRHTRWKADAEFGLTRVPPPPSCAGLEQADVRSLVRCVRGAFQDPTHVSFWNSNSFWYYTRADQNRFIDCPVRFHANRLKHSFPSEWHREHQIVYRKADLLKVAGRVPGGVAI
jgi:hypothetical protein